MSRSARGRRIELQVLVRQRFPEMTQDQAVSAIQSADVVVDGRILDNPRSMVSTDASLRVTTSGPLQGERKLGWALHRFQPTISGRVALDVGACTGGFTTTLLGAGAARVYAVDAGAGQLRGTLRQDPRVVNLERTNVAALTAGLIPDALGVVTIDVSYLSLTSAVEQLGGLAFADRAELIGLVKPMFELRLATISNERNVLDRALQRASAGIESAGWSVIDADECPVRGNRGAIEFFVFARR